MKYRHNPLVDYASLIPPTGYEVRLMGMPHLEQIQNPKSEILRSPALSCCCAGLKAMHFFLSTSPKNMS